MREEEQNEKMAFLNSPVFKELVEKALQNDGVEKTFLGSLAEWQAARVVRRATKKVAKLFHALAEEGMVAYVKQLQEEKVDLDLLFSIRQFKKCADFYDNEAKLVKDMLKEYHAYVFGGHVIDTIFNNPRQEEDMVDYRTLPWRLF